VSRFRLSPNARRDIREIWEFVASDSIEAAGRVRRRIQANCQILAARPFLGHRRDDLTARPDVRFWPVYTYLIVYRPYTAPLEILRVLHGKRDLAEMLEK